MLPCTPCIRFFHGTYILKWRSFRFVSKRVNLQQDYRGGPVPMASGAMMGPDAPSQVPRMDLEAVQTPVLKDKEPTAKSEVGRIRSLFPETWLWTLFDTG